MADRHPAPLRLLALLCWALHIILPPPLSPSLSIAHFLFFPLCAIACPVFSFRNKSFLSLWLILLFLDYFFFLSLLVLFLSYFFIPALCAIAPHGNCAGHVILALYVILGFTAGWPEWQICSQCATIKCKTKGLGKHFLDRSRVSILIYYPLCMLRLGTSLPGLAMSLPIKSFTFWMTLEECVRVCVNAHPKSGSIPLLK